ERVPRQLLIVEVVLSLRRYRLRVPLVTLRQDLAEVRVPCMVLDEHRQRRTLLLQRELAADDDADPVLLRLLVGADDPIEAVTIGDRDRVVAELRGAMDHLLRRRSPREEAEARPDRELDVALSRLDRATKLRDLLHDRVALGTRRALLVRLIGERHARG